jgi:hypothetical protein
MVEKTAFGNEFWTEMVPSSVLSNRDPVLANNFPVPAVQKAMIGDELVNSFEWRYFSRQVFCNVQTRPSVLDSCW